MPQHFRKRSATLLTATALVLPLGALAVDGTAAASTPTHDTSTLAGKLAAVRGTAGLQIRMSAFLDADATAINAADALGSDGATLAAGSPTSVLSPAVTVNQDTGAAPQNETSIAVDPNNPRIVVGSANDYVARTWSCTIAGTPCSALADGYSGTYLSVNGGQSWVANSTDPQHLGTLIPGVEHLTGGPYDGGGDPAVTFDSRGHVFYAGLGFNRNDSASGVEVSKGTIAGGTLTWSQPSWVTQTNNKAVFNDKEWVAADHYATSRFRDRVYVSYTRFIFSPQGKYVQSPIFTSFSSDGGQTFSSPTSISHNVLYGQGSRPVVAPDGTVYILWDGSTRLASTDSIYMVKSTDGGVSWSAPSAVAPLQDIGTLKDTRFRVNSYPAVAAGPAGSLYATWTSSTKNGATTFGPSSFCAYAAAEPAGCHAQAVYAVSRDEGATWSTPAAVPGTAANRSAIGYPVTQPDNTTLAAPAASPADSVYPAVSVSANGNVYLSSYLADVVSPWQTCTTYDPAGSIHCLTTGPYTNNSKLDYLVSKIGGATQMATTAPVNTRYQFRGGFIGDYTDLAVGSDDVAHPMWTDTNNTQKVNWFYGTNFNGLPANQQDVVTNALHF
ncbi:MAG: sialidase family protein [Dermatophilaceae bacterium]